MTEAEWLACVADDTGDMQDCLTGKGSARKLRLFACACCLHVEHLLGDERSRRAVEIAERYADGVVDGSELEAAWLGADAASTEIYDAFQEGDSEQPYLASLSAHWAAMSGDYCTAVESVSHAAFYAQKATDTMAERGWQARVLAERAWQAKVLCDILGGPLPLPGIRVEWLTSAVVPLAQTIYEERALDLMPILADALEDAGCTDTDLLGHLRGQGPHVRGCWVVDLLLGRA